MTDDDAEAAQFRGARAMLSLSLIDLSLEAGVSVATVRALETGECRRVSEEAGLKVRTALIAAGIRFGRSDGPTVDISLDRRASVLDP